MIFLTGLVSEKPEKERWIIVLDAGHGGRDPGAVGSYSYEKDITLAVALKTGELIEKNISNAKVIYTRKTDVFMDLADRANLANKNKADLFISIHANWHRYRNTYGAETYVMGHHKDQQNLEVAMKENEVILLEKDYTTKYEGFDPKSPESYIIFTLMQSAYFDQSTDLASRLQVQFREQIRRYDRGVKQAGFWVLYMTTMPSVLIEIGFISNPAEEKYINSKRGQEEIANAIFNACREYIVETEKKTGISAIKTEDKSAENSLKPGLPEAPGQIIFMVQIVSSSKRIDTNPRNFKNLTDIIELHSANRYKYATGKFADYESAMSYRKQIEALFPDAFVIAVKENKILPLQEALKK
ncbi:MAG: N-acetylmuramoyl-L-alanine amidase family protein [Bacteroidales bacterium]